MSTAAPPIATATVNGVVATSAMTSQEIFNAHLQAQGGAPVDFKAGARSGPPLHVHADHTGGGLADAQAVAAKAPPSPKALEASNKLQEFDAEMRAKGLQTGAPTAQSSREITSEAEEAIPAPAKPGWQSHIEDREWVGLEKLTTADTSGYTIPRYVNDQRLHVSTFELLKQAKAAGISQAQVNAVMREQARNMGWVKA